MFRERCALTSYWFRFCRIDSFRFQGIHESLACFPLRDRQVLARESLTFIGQKIHKIDFYVFFSQPIHWKLHISWISHNRKTWCSFRIILLYVDFWKARDPQTAILKTDVLVFWRFLCPRDFCWSWSQVQDKNPSHGIKVNSSVDPIRCHFRCAFENSPSEYYWLNFRLDQGSAGRDGPRPRRPRGRPRTRTSRIRSRTGTRTSEADKF